MLGQLGLEDTQIGNVERERDQRVLGHQVPSLRASAKPDTILHPLALLCTRYMSCNLQQVIEDYSLFGNIP